MSGFNRLSSTRRRVLDALIASVVAQQQLQDCLANQAFPDDVFAKIRMDVDKLWVPSRKLDGRTLDEWNRMPPSEVAPNRRGVYALGGALAGALGGAALATYAKRNTQAVATATTTAAASNFNDLEQKVKVISEANSILRDYNHFYDKHRKDIQNDAIGALFDQVLVSNQENSKLRAELEETRRSLQTAATNTLQVDMDWSQSYTELSNRHEALVDENRELAVIVEENRVLKESQRKLVDALALSQTRLTHVEGELAKERVERENLQTVLDRALKASWTNDVNWENMKNGWMQDKDALLTTITTQQNLLMATQSALQQAQAELQTAKDVSSRAIQQQWKCDLELNEKMGDNETLMSDLIYTKQMLISTSDALMVKTNEQAQTEAALGRASKQLWADGIDCANRVTNTERDTMILLASVRELLSRLLFTSNELQAQKLTPDTLPEALRRVWMADMANTQHVAPPERPDQLPASASEDVDMGANADKNSLLSAIDDVTRRLVWKDNQLQTTNSELTALQRIVTDALADVWKCELTKQPDVESPPQYLTADIVSAMLPTLIASDNKTQFLQLENTDLKDLLQRSLSGLWRDDIDCKHLMGVETNLKEVESITAQLIAQLADQQKTILEQTQNLELSEAKVGLIENQRDSALASKLACALELEFAKENVEIVTSLQASTMRDLIATTQKFDTLKAQCASTQTALEQSSRDVWRLSVELQASQAKVQESGKVLEAEVKEAHHDEETESKLIAQLAELQKDILELTQNLELSEAKVGLIENQRDNALDSKLACALELQSARTDIGIITSLQANTMRDLIASTQKFDTLKSQCAETRKALEQSSYDVLRLSMELQASQAKAQELSQAGEAKAQELSKAEETEAKLIAQLAELQKDLLELTQNHELLEAKVGLIETQRDSALDSKLACALEFQSARANFANITARYAETQTLLDQAYRKTQSHSVELQAKAQETIALQSELASQQIELDRCTAQNAELQAQLGGSNAIAGQQQQALDLLRTTNEELQSKLNACEEKSSKLATSDQDTASLITELAACQKSLLQAMVDQSLSEADHDQTKLRLEKALDAVLACKLEQGTLQDELASVRTRLSEAESARQRCDEAVAELQQNERALDSELQDKNDQLNEQKVDRAVGSFVMEKAAGTRGLSSQVQALRTCVERNGDTCAQDFFKKGNAKTDKYIRSLFGRLVGMAKSICKPDAGSLRPSQDAGPNLQGAAVVRRLARNKRLRANPLPRVLPTVPPFVPPAPPTTSARDARVARWNLRRVGEPEEKGEDARAEAKDQEGSRGQKRDRQALGDEPEDEEETLEPETESDVETEIQSDADDEQSATARLEESSQV